MEPRPLTPSMEERLTGAAYGLLALGELGPDFDILRAQGESHDAAAHHSTDNGCGTDAQDDELIPAGRFSAPQAYTPPTVLEHMDALQRLRARLAVMSTQLDTVTDAAGRLDAQYQHANELLDDMQLSQLVARRQQAMQLLRTRADALLAQTTAETAQVIAAHDDATPAGLTLRE